MPNDPSFTPALAAFTPALAAPSLAACINPGPPPVTMSHPISANAAAARLTSSYTNVPG